MKLTEFAHANNHELIRSAYPYSLRQNVVNELVAKAVVADGFPYSNREIEEVLKQVVDELPDNYNTFIGKDSRVFVKLSW